MFNPKTLFVAPEVNPINRKARTIPLFNPINVYGRVFFLLEVRINEFTTRSRPELMCLYSPERLEIWLPTTMRKDGVLKTREPEEETLNFGRRL